MSLLRVTPSTSPSDRISAGLTEVHHGIVGSRGEIVRLIREQAAQRSALVDTRYRLCAEMIQVDRALTGRPLYTSEQEIARARDGAPVETNARGVTPVDATTAKSLDVYGLHRAADVKPPRIDERTAWRRILGVA